MKGLLFDLQRFSLHDGPGIRTTVFFKGCNLRCLWCHNPESQAGAPELMFYAEKCVRCGACAAVCENAFDRSACRACGECAAVCRHGARERSGYYADAADTAQRCLRDAAYYRTSGGGVTLSGGEPLLQAEFAAALLSSLKAQGVHTAVETAANVPEETLRRILPLTDLVLCDIKCVDGALHRSLTGVDNRQILANVRFLKEHAADVRFRMPYIPGVNSDALPEVAALCRGYTLELMAYHTIGVSKYAALGRPYSIEADPPTPARMAALAAQYGAVFTPAGI